MKQLLPSSTTLYEGVSCLLALLARPKCGPIEDWRATTFKVSGLQHHPVMIFSVRLLQVLLGGTYRAYVLLSRTVLGAANEDHSTGDV